jgi:radical SAM superfamily enzyme YgiQ (UPF0313 family)
MKRILLIQPSPHTDSLVFGYMNPYALEILAAGVLKEIRDIRVEIIDFRVEGEIKGLNKIRKFNPDIVGITGITIDFPMMMNILKHVKGFSREIITIVGGHHATIAPSDFHDPRVDIIVHGQGIESLKEIILASSTRNFRAIRGITFRGDNGAFNKNPDRNDFSEIRRWPLPAYHLTGKYGKFYSAFGRKYRVVTTAMGCPFRCSFCACWRVMSGKYVTRSPEAVVKEISSAKEKYIFFGDDLTFGDIGRAKEIATMIKITNIKKFYNGYCRADIIVKHPDVFRLWKEIGLFGLTVGMESLSDEDLAAYNKKSTIETNERANDILLDIGIHNHAHIMIKPSFSGSDFERLIHYTQKRLGVAHPVFPILTPLPGTLLFNEMRDKIRINKHQYYDLAHPITDITTRSEVSNFYENIFRVYRENYSYKRWFANRLRRFVNLLAMGKIFSKAAINGPELISIPVARGWIKRQSKKLTPFFEHFK